MLPTALPPVVMTLFVALGFAGKVKTVVQQTRAWCAVGTRARQGSLLCAFDSWMCSAELGWLSSLRLA